MNENEFCMYGKVYVAVACDSCNGCAFDESICPGVNCADADRKDGRNVIFVEKQS